MPLLEVKDCHAGYGTGSILNGIDLTVAKGELIGIVGPNGHGKTTLLRAISGLLPRTQGSIALNGRSILGLAPEKIARMGLAHVPQGDLVYKNMTILENLLVGGYANRSDARSQAQLDKVFALFPKLEQRAEQIASSLSGGERRMLGIGRGLMMGDCRLLVLDEPSLGLAPVVIDQIYAAIDELRATGMTIVVVEENIARVANHADRLHLMDGGHFVWSGVPAEMHENRKIIDTYLGA
ncbi:ABC transporter ATP-binding protein [Sulfitobacter sp. HI0054]|uniref:High-affinity branched-chain amino acid transport ATP-binding protein LivF n=1 Tax=Pseudosulfitobacter pseudonitzschiae TaxID=1402135 RepID=A0A221K9K1_9RHOB|nr:MULTISPECIES: ABC transporter ATP-binding protein [Rhodobacterales]ASM75645.1 high-affinity branched-chain amino acid transport ATP-binding protein LivF [Pseudosulfitobacter pseudonitzschiae]KZY52332.1 ABC transporter ATP-binding protein [Sulfitobacter sp. HI0054]|tara:strand:- start:4011 stop:4724 length:714 start_codon:yes stop_codon:yes gene_type:complete